MKTKLLVMFVLLVLTFGVTGATCQDNPTKSVDQIRDILKRAQSDDEKISGVAIDELLKLPADSIPKLFEIVKKDPPCTAVTAAGVIAKLNPTHPELVPELTKIVRGATASSLVNWEKDGLCRRYAAFALPESAEGLRSILNLLETGNTWEKQAAIFALDDFTEVAAYNDRPGEVDVMMEIVPALAKLQKSKDEVISEMSSEVLTQISGHLPKKLADLAKKLVAY